MSTGAGTMPVMRWLVRIALGAALLAGAAIAVQSAIHPVSTLMLARRALGEPVDRRWVPLSAVSPKLIASVILSEDGQFCREHGVDLGALREVIEDGDGAPSRGASTITMQVAKNLFLWPGRSYVRKALEIPLAVVLDLLWGKRKVLETYLNVAEWGDGVYGIEAAAQRDFHVPASALTARQAALLATALPNPALRLPTHPSRRHRLLAQRILDMQPIAGPHVACLR